MKCLFALPVLLLGGFPPMAMAQSTGTFTVTGSMTTPRVGHTATLLTNGVVLITGGSPYGVIRRSCHLEPRKALKGRCKTCGPSTAAVPMRHSSNEGTAGWAVGAAQVAPEESHKKGR